MGLGQKADTNPNRLESYPNSSFFIIKIKSKNIVAKFRYVALKE